MRYHNITHADMVNGEGLRTVLWVAGCSHKCKGCQNPTTWNPNGGIEFDKEAIDEIELSLMNDDIQGITYSGGDPMHKDNVYTLILLSLALKETFPRKDIWLYTGYTYEEILNGDNEDRKELLSLVDVLVDGKFEESLADKQYKWAGSTNQRIIDVKKSLDSGTVVHYTK